MRPLLGWVLSYIQLRTIVRIPPSDACIYGSGRSKMHWLTSISSCKYLSGHYSRSSGPFHASHIIIIIHHCYISFLLSSFTDYPDVPIPLPTLLHFILIILPHVTLSAFILISGFKCFSNVPDFYMCFHLPFHMFSLFFPCALTLFTTFSELLWHLIFYVLSSLCSQLILTQYINQCIFLVVLQFVNWCWFSSSPIFSLSLLYPLKALSSLSLLSLSSGNYIFTKMKLRPSNLTSQLMSRPLTKF